ncbi:MAG: hypothetical protein KKA42_11475, partial [candidate division Zixibacteria bacterium]|nr:hypothetical protein [candidate division Zixibacteria bacterium]
MEHWKPGRVTVACLLILPAIMVTCFPPTAIAVPGDTVSSVPAPFRCPQGLAFDGKHLWVSDRSSDLIYRVD